MFNNIKDIDILNQSVDELLFLFNKYKIHINEIGNGNQIKLERFGIIISFSQKTICEGSPKNVCAEIIKKFIEHPDYKKATTTYLSTIIKKTTINHSTVVSIEEKKKLIRQKLIRDGLLL